jgi:hypothetical protein
MPNMDSYMYMYLTCYISICRSIYLSVPTPAAAADARPSAAVASDGVAAAGQKDPYLNLRLLRGHDEVVVAGPCKVYVHDQFFF